MPSKTFAVDFETSGFRRASRQMSEMGDRSSSAGSKMKTAGKIGAAGIAAIGTAVAGAVAGLGKLISSTSEYARQVDNAAAQSGMTAESIQEIAFATKQVSGTDFDTTRDGLKELALRSAEAAEGTGEAQEAFERLGISQSELQSMTTAEVFKRVQKEMKGLSKQQRILTAEQVFGGEAGEKFAETMGLSADQMANLRKEARASGQVLSGSQIKALEQSRKAWSALWGQIKGVGRQLAVGLTPVVQRVVPLLRAAVERIRGLFQGVDAQSFGSIFSVAGQAIQRLWQMSKQVGGALVDVWRSVASAISSIWSTWGGFITDIATTLAKNIQGIFTGFVGVVSGIWNTLVGVLTGNWSKAWQGIKKVVTTVTLTIADLILGFAESVLGTVGSLAEKVGMDDVAGSIDNARQSVTAFRKEVKKANQEAAGVKQTYESIGNIASQGFSTAAFGATPGFGASAETGTIGGQQGGAMGGGGAMMHWMNQIRKMRKEMKRTKQEGISLSNTVGQGFRQIAGGIGQAVVQIGKGGNAIKGFARTAKRALKQVIQKIVQAIIVQKVLGGLFSAIGGPVGGFLSSAIGVGGKSAATGTAPMSKVMTSGSARLAQGEITIPVEVQSQATSQGNQRRKRTGRKI